MNCNNYNTIKVTAGNAFSLLLPLKAKQYISEQPIEEVINAALLTGVQVLLNGEEWNEYELGEDGVLVHFPSTLSKGVYNIELTAKYGGIAIRAAYFQCLSIVAWSYQADAENYIPTSPLVADAAFVISANGDEELTALKEQYRDAIAATEAEKAEYERKVAELNGVAQESTSQEILEKVSGIKGDNPDATNSKILNAIQNIVGTGLLANEEVKVKVSIPNSEEFDWSGYAVILNDKSANTQEVKNLNADGTCTFNVPIGHTYEIGFPQLTAYAAPMKQTYAAIQRERYVVHEYAEPDGIEVLKITVMSQLSGGTSTILDGSVLSVTDTNGEVYSGVVNGYECHISIPYGKTYTLVQPFIEGYRSESGSATYTALAPIRNVTLRYSEDGYGIFGVDEDGKLYTIDEIEAMHDKTTIKYGFYNDLELASASRIDSGFGNGFYWELGKESLGYMQWATQNVAFDTSRLPYFGNKAAASKATAGAYYTKVIEEVGPSVIADSANPTPAASACLSKTAYFGGKEHQGFLPAYGQIKKIATTNRTLFQAFYSALGRTAPAIWSGNWWTSCQVNATDAVVLPNGGFRNGGKSSSHQVFCCFDL